MSTRLDLALQKFPEHEDGIRLLAERDPSGNFKYLDWGARMLAAGQALAPEVADVLDLFHRFSGQWVGRARHGRRQLPRDRIRSDLYTYRPQDFATFRDALFKIRRAQDKKRRERERLYRIEGSVEAVVVYDSPDLIVRHIQNKQASVHYGGATKWCISMLREGYFEDYEAHNATFFFFERKTPVGDEFDKVALMIPRSRDQGYWAANVAVFNSLDLQVDMMGLARVYGVRVFDIFRMIHECSEQYPGSAIFHVYAGSATSDQLEAVVTDLVQGKLKKSVSPYEIGPMLEAICCNDAASPALLEGIAREAVALFTAAWKLPNRRRRMGRNRRGGDRVKELWRTVAAALVTHPQTPTDLRERLVKDLRRRHVRIDQIHRESDRGRIGVTWDSPGIRLGRHRRVRFRKRRRETPSWLRQYARKLDGMAARVRKRLKKVEQKLAAKKQKLKKKQRKRK